MTTDGPTDNKAKNPLDHDHPGQGILLTIIAGFVIAGMDAINKYLMADVPFAQVVWGRYFFHTVIVFAVFAATGGLDFIKPKAPATQTVRAILLLAVTASLYMAIQFVPLADATAVMFFAPVLVTALAGVMLGEQLGWRRYAAVFAGFIGVLIIVQPGAGVMEPAILFACVTAVTFALYILTTRKLQGRDTERVTLFHATVLGAVIMTIILPFVWMPMTWTQVGLLALGGAFGAMGHFLWVKAFHMAPAATLAPFLNTQLVGAAIYSVVIFGDPLTTSFIAGAGLIVGAGLFIWYREQRSGKSERSPYESLSE